MSIKIENLTHVYMANTPFEKKALDNVSVETVSYTHLDVYKRQIQHYSIRYCLFRINTVFCLVLYYNYIQAR